LFESGARLLLNFREDWLRLTPETALEPLIPICDAHHHLWYSQEAYSVEDYLKDISGGHKITKSVFVESRMMFRSQGPEEMRPVGETEYIQKVATRNVSLAKTNVAAAIVGYADLTLGSSIYPVLEAHIAAGKGSFRGIRHVVSHDSTGSVRYRLKIPAGLLLDSKFQQGFSCLNKFNLSFDAMLFHHQLSELAALAKQFPDTVIIINHCGVPLGSGIYAAQREPVFQEWKKGIEMLAEFPRVFVKVGGLGMEINGFQWSELTAPPGSAQLAKAYEPYFLHCVEHFGVKRCMFESNFPVDKRSYSYTILWNALKRITKDFSICERHALLYDTAVRVYRLPKKV